MSLEVKGRLSVVVEVAAEEVEEVEEGEVVEEEVGVEVEAEEEAEVAEEEEDVEDLLMINWHLKATQRNKKTLFN